MSPLGGGNQGTIFKINTDGNGFGLLHSFVISAADGLNPSGDVTVVGSTLSGMTYGGGTSGIGTLFRMNTDGGGFSLLHSFTSRVTDGKRPFGSLAFDGSTFYGMRERSDNSGDGLGTVFALAVPILLGDYNGNGIVDAADYTVWRDHLGQTYALQNRDPGERAGGRRGLRRLGGAYRIDGERIRLGQPSCTRCPLAFPSRSAGAGGGIAGGRGSDRMRRVATAAAWWLMARHARLRRHDFWLVAVSGRLGAKHQPLSSLNLWHEVRRGLELGDES